jgi:hypothetical protein
MASVSTAAKQQRIIHVFSISYFNRFIVTMLVDQYHIVIGGEKLSGYLLNAQHPDGWAKAKFFLQHGFITEGDLITLLMFFISNYEVSQKLETKFGTKYIVEGAIPGLQAASLRTVWIVLNGEKSCRFVTAYPL